MFEDLPNVVLHLSNDLKWQTLVCQPNRCLTEFTHEFYIGIPPIKPNTIEPNFAFARNQHTSFFASVINEILDLEEVDDAFQKVMATVTDEQMEGQLKVSYEPRTKWDVKTAIDCRIKRTCLKSLPKVLSLFITSSIFPTTHNLYFNKERFLLLHQILM